MRMLPLDQILPPNDEARTVVAFVEQADLSELYDSIRAVEGGPGRSPIDPQILLSLWLYATIKGVGSAGFGAAVQVPFGLSYGSHAVGLPRRPRRDLGPVADAADRAVAVGRSCDAGASGSGWRACVRSRSAPTGVSCRRCRLRSSRARDSVRKPIWPMAGTSRTTTSMNSTIPATAPRGKIINFVERRLIVSESQHRAQ